ncbi:MAG: SDR family oxidoreductase [Verrucomicrobiota bacterium JB022]|nr:SDR family oxidoreductase [Verrucomicrobiota bacterium JB022]
MKPSHTLALGALGLGAATVWWHQRRPRYSFADRVVVLTGGSRGLGLELARQLAEEGAVLALLARDSDELLTAAHELRALGGAVRCYPCDVGSAEEVEHTMHAIDADLGRIDVLIHNAGRILCAPVDNLRREDFEASMRTHFYGALHTTLAALPIMHRQREARILYVSSIGGKIGIPHMAPYSASKHALAGFARALAAELRPTQIRVTLACPGLLRTGSHRAALFGGKAEAEARVFTAAATAPGVTVSADLAARRLIEACRAGRAEVTFPWQWRMTGAGFELFPEMAQTANGLISRVLPAATPTHTPIRTGKEVRGPQPGVWSKRHEEQLAARMHQH